MQNNIPLITIITPTYNRKKLLEKAILSVINQKKDIPFEWELLIVDDGSNDETKKFIQKYLDEYKNNIKYFYQENMGVGKARNIGLDNMSGNSDYTIFLDSDDELVYDCIYTCLNKFEELKNIGDYFKTIGLFFHCKTDTGKIIGNMNLFNFENLVFKYKDFLENKINWEKGSIIKSQIYTTNKNFRFPEDVINEYILRCNIIKFVDMNNLNFLYIDYIGRIYGTINENNNNKITKTISKDRFRKNAIGNERALEII